MAKQRLPRFTMPLDSIRRLAPMLMVAAKTATLLRKTHMMVSPFDGIRCTTFLTMCFSATNNTLWLVGCSAKIATVMLKHIPLAELLK